MSGKLWESFLRDDVETFRGVLASASYKTSGGTPNSKAGGSGSVIASSPGLFHRSKKLGEASPGTSLPDRSTTSRPGRTISREELNARDHHGRTLLHHVASSPKPTAIDFAIMLLETPFIDIYAQDWESGWTALHRALYAGNAAIAQALMARDIRDATDFSKAGSPGHPGGGLIKVKDREGYSPFDVYGATISSREIKRMVLPAMEHDPLLADIENKDDESSASSFGEDMDEDGHAPRGVLRPRVNLLADEVYTFGSNKNLNLGVGDQDDRQFPERMTLKRPEHLLRRFFRESQEQRDDDHPPGSDDAEDLPALIRNKPMKYQDIVMSKLHTAILTTDPEANLFTCGFGPGGRLGTGDESTRFSFVCIEGGGLANRKVVSVALGQDHTLAISEQGEIFSWGSNKYGQLGYSLPRATNRDDVPIQTTPRQIFNPFKKEMILGAAASAIHSVVFSHAGLYTFGKNEGQLGLVDSDARSLEAQTTPRRVGASLFNAPIHTVSAIDQATAILLHNHEVWVFAQYGYLKLSFPLDISSKFIRDSFMTTRYDTAVNRIIKIRSGGNTICALSSFGEVFTVQVNTKTDTPSATSTTNPSKIRNAVAPPARVWALKKAHMAVKDVDVGQDGSIIICTASGSAWRKEKRGKSKDGVAKEYKFARVPGLSRVVGVCSNSFGAFAAAQRDCDVTREQIEVGPSTLWKDLLPLSPFGVFASMASGDSEAGDGDALLVEPTLAIKQAVMSASDIESFFPPPPINLPQGVVLITTTLSDVQIPVHEFVLSGRSPVLRKAFHTFRKSTTYTLPDILSISHDQDNRTRVLFHNLDIYTLLNFAFFIYTDNIFDVWHLARHTPESALRYRQVRTEVMRLGTHLNIPSIERAARLMIDPHKSLKFDMALALTDPAFFESGDVVIELNHDEVRVHSQVICQRSLFFDVLFNGRSGGRWLLSRRENSNSSDSSIRVDLRHIDRPVFDFVLRYLYADTDEQLFDEVRSKDLDSFMDLVFEVAFVANELMIDRLAQVCQRVIGQFVNARNVCTLLNSIAPCYVTEFRDAALEYICLNLEGLLTNRGLEDLNENLLTALDQVCHDNQLSSFPVSRGRNTDEYILEMYPELVSFIESDRQQRIDSMKLRTRINNTNEGKRMPNGDKTPSSAQRTKTKDVFTTPSKSPSLRPRQSAGELMFAMDDDQFLSPGDGLKGKSVVRGSRGVDAHYDSPALASSLADDSPHGGRSYLDDLMTSSHEPESPSYSRAQNRINNSAVPWTNPSSATSVVTGSKKPLKDIMQEATSSQGQVSNLSLGMSAKRENSQSATAPKMSQKERKKMQMLQMQEMLAAEERSKEARANPWGVPPPPPPTSSSSSAAAAASSKVVAPVNGSEPTPAEMGKPTRKPSMTMRQTVAGTPPLKGQSMGSVPVKSGDGVAGGAQRTPPSQPSLPSSQLNLTPTHPPTQQPLQQQTQQKPTHSIRHNAASTHPPTSNPTPTSTSKSKPAKRSKRTSLSTILLQQQTEKDEIREAATAKHNLHDIQLEQQFQEWWNKESRRIQGLPDEEEPEEEQTGDDIGKGGKKDKSHKNDGRGGRKGQAQGNASSSGSGQNANRKRGRGGAGGAGGGGGAGKAAGSADAATNTNTNTAGRGRHLPSRQKNGHDGPAPGGSSSLPKKDSSASANATANVHTQKAPPQRTEHAPHHRQQHQHQTKKANVNHRESVPVSGSGGGGAAPRGGGGGGERGRGGAHRGRGR